MNAFNNPAARVVGIGRGLGEQLGAKARRPRAAGAGGPVES